MTAALAASILARRHWPTETLTAEHHPSDHGMKYTVHLDGGKHHGTVIHCPTRRSVLRLFDQIVAYRSRYAEHPFLAGV